MGDIELLINTDCFLGRWAESKLFGYEGYITVMLKYSFAFKLWFEIIFQSL